MNSQCVVNMYFILKYHIVIAYSCLYKMTWSKTDSDGSLFQVERVHVLGSLGITWLYAFVLHLYSLLITLEYRGCMVFNATFNTISVISWRSVLLVDKTGYSRENHRPAASYWQTLSHNVASSTPSHDRDSNSQL